MIFKFACAVMTAAALTMSAPAMAQDTPAAPPAATAAVPRLPVQIVVLPDGRVAIAFDTPPTSEPGPGTEKLILPDGRTAFAPVKTTPSILPFWAQSIAALRDEPVTLTTGTVEGGATIAAVPFKYNKTFRLKSERTYKLWGKTYIEAQAGSPGFYGGAFDSPTQPYRMLCIFPLNAKDPYKSPECFLRSGLPALQGATRSVTTFSNLPTFYQAVSQYGNEQINRAEPLDIEDGDIAIDHDFRLLLTVKKWKDGKPMVEWRSDGVVVKAETLDPAPDGRFSFPVNDGTLVLTPDPKTKSNTVVTFTPGPPAGNN